ncbi:MAG TPA: fumarylacetoacetate hydrolase family protein [Stellaceae bacterium]|jgi:2-oxo-3-hexenedioate decarboxylase/2-keto-4-pentenoate hydratase|nr:fumarylacetoacetate hydrolase family protein [Stellaceae bacterium]
MAALDVRQKAEEISRLFRECRQTDILPPELMPTGLDEAYAIRDAFEALGIARGRGAVAGYKIGLTTPIMQKLCGVDEPCFGAIFAKEVHQPRAELKTADYCRLGIETEIAVRLGEDLPQGGDRNRVGAAVDACMAAIEVLEDLRHDYKRLSAAAMVAGNVWNAGAVLGAPVTDWRAVDLAKAAARLTINGREIGSGHGGDVMGNPLNALAWLANKCAAMGRPLKRGMVVLTGSMVPIQFPNPGDHAIVEVAGLGTAELVAI